MNERTFIGMISEMKALIISSPALWVQSECETTRSLQGTAEFSTLQKSAFIWSVSM